MTMKYFSDDAHSITSKHVADKFKLDSLQLEGLLCNYIIFHCI
jgi:hypothetical protein